MIKNYLKIAWRNLLKNKVFASMNTVGLSVAFAVAMLLSMDALFDLSFDDFHENKNEIYQVYQSQQTAKGTLVGTSMAAPLKNILTEKLPAIERAARYVEHQYLVIYKGKELTIDTEWTDPEFMDMFTFPTKEGNAKKALMNKNGLILTEKTASKIFGEEKAIGKTIQILLDGVETPYVVQAIVENPPKNSSFTFESLGNFESLPSYKKNKNNWDSEYHNLYVQASSAITAKEVLPITQEIFDLNHPDAIDQLKKDGAQPNEEGLYHTYNFLPLKDVHFASYFKGVLKVSRFSPYLLLSIAMLIIFIACVNFMNMSIAKSSNRLKEIGMRKTLGAHKNHLFFQFWSESLLIFLFSLALSILLSFLLLDEFKSLFRTSASFAQLVTPSIILMGIFLVLGISLIAGGYPALLMSKLGTIQALKGKLSVKKGSLLRNSLITVQFAIAILLITGTIVIWSQLQYMKTKDLGYNKEQVISFVLNGKKDNRKAVQLLRNELLSDPNILSISASDNNLGMGKDGSMYRSVLGFTHKGKSVKTHMLVVDYNYPETLGLELVAGRSFDKKFTSDSTSVVINETMAKSLGEEDPIGKMIGGEDDKHTIIGVMKDYHFQKLNTKIEPISFFMKNEWDVLYAFVKVAPTGMKASYDKIEAAWNKIEPNATFMGSFLDENLDRTFRKERNTITMVSIASAIAIVLSCIGLFAMSLLVVTQRTKEIGVRKVIGASVSSIAYLLTKDFLKLVGIAFLVATPIAWWFLSDWLKDYAYRVDLSAWFFLISGVLAMLIAIVTIGGKSVSAAMQNPVKSLRTE